MTWGDDLEGLILALTRAADFTALRFHCIPDTGVAELSSKARRGAPWNSSACAYVGLPPSPDVFQAGSLGQRLLGVHLRLQGVCSLSPL